MLTGHTMGARSGRDAGGARQSLQGEDRRIFRPPARESSEFMRQQWKDRETKARQQAEKAGNVVIADFDKNACEAAMGGIHDKAVNDPRLHPLVERICQAQ